jgi:hypothetical protein
VGGVGRNTLDPGSVSGWSKAIATVATVAVAGVGAGTAIKDHRAVEGPRHATPPAAGRAMAHVSAGAAKPARSARGRAPSAGASAAPARRAGAGDTSGDAPPGGDSGDPAPGGSHERFSAGGQTPAAGTTTAPKPAEGGGDRGGVAPAAPPSSVSGGGPAPTQPQQAVSNALDKLGAGAGTPPTDAAPAVRAPQPPSLGDVVGGAQDAVSGLNTPPAAPATISTVDPEKSASTGFGATVSTVVTRTLSSTTARRAAS